MKRIPLAIIFGMTLTSLNAAAAPMVATGTVHWMRDLDLALAASASSGKPLFALFQEVPGCAGCQQFGRDVLSNDLVVAAIESEFTPLLIHNNASGKDAQALQRFNEPAWNYQVVRFLTAKGEDIIPRQDRVWETAPLAERMTATLTKAGRPVPPYLRLLTSETSTRLRTAVFAMARFWTGEMKLGQIDGVITTEAGFMAGREVTLVRYDPTLITLPDLISRAEKVECANTVFLTPAEISAVPASRLKVVPLTKYEPAPASDQKRQLAGTAVSKLTLTPAQATKLNAWFRSDPTVGVSYLTPSQQVQLHR